MQFHLNGFNPGDPTISQASKVGEKQASTGDRPPTTVDVLIVGCGPAGLALASQLSIFSHITTCIVEQKSGPLVLGQADGVACRSMELFESLSFSERVLKEAYWVNETSFWKPSPENPGSIIRSGRIQDTEDDLSEFPHVILNQARIHDFLLDKMLRSPTRLKPFYSCRFNDLKVRTGRFSRPIEATLERCDEEHKGEVEKIEASYVVGCDGAHSSVRKSLGLSMKGDSANQAWGVMDVLAITDFPDIRLKTAIYSANEGSILIIPREGGYLVRFYIELDKLNENERVSKQKITSERLVAAAKRILHPYSFDVKEIVWWSVYEIGQRISDRFDDISSKADQSQPPRVFITGDACHTHSPKAGQGMNVSLRDSFNLGWKLAAVIRGQCSSAILHTYSAERRKEARELIDFDRKFAKMFGARPKVGSLTDEGVVDPAEFQEYFVKQGRFTAGTTTQYSQSLITAKPEYQHLASGFVIGKRFHSAPVIRLADAKPIQLGHVIKADGRWRILIFSDFRHSTHLFFDLCEFLASSQSSPINKYTPSGSDIDTVIDLRAVFQQHHRELTMDEFPALLRPQKGRYGLRDYEKMFCALQSQDRDIFEMRGLDRSAGCIVVVRPDQHVANVLPLDAYEALTSFFDGFMKEASGCRFADFP